MAVLVEDGFEDVELTGPAEGLRAAGVDVTLVGPVAGRQYTGKRGATVTSDVAAGVAEAGLVWLAVLQWMRRASIGLF